jgi:gliding motility-associated-like protein
MKKLLSFLVISALYTTSLYSQNYNMGNLGTVSGACGGSFYDSGGNGGAYSNSETYTATFCAPAGQYITFTFSSFVVENTYEHLYVYNGPNVSSPLVGNYSGSNSPGTVTSTLGGCITFRFTSDGSVTNPGWAAAISCSATPPPPPPPVPNSCATAQPFCTGSGITFPASTGTTAQTGPNYGCLISQPNPAWYYLQIATAGNININLSNSANVDIDFAAWGPFASQAAMCAGITAAPSDCSFSAASTEQINITGATVGQWYMVVITNYSNQPTNINASAGSGTTGSTNCNILCNMTSLTAVPGACAPATNTYTVTGSIGFQYPPTSGTLTVTSSCGGSVSIPAPWTNPISYTLPNITATGGACNLTATFSADPTCTLTQPYTSPAPCNTCSVIASNNGPICPSTSFNLSATNAGAGATYSWSGPSGFTSSSQNPTATSSATSGTYTYTVTATVSGSSCTSTTTVTVKPIPVITAPTVLPVCHGAAVAAQSFTSTPTGATYTWTNSNAAIGLPGSGTGPVSGFTATNTTGSPITATITVTPTLNGCIGLPITYTITVNPQPTSTFTQPANQCLTGNTFSFTNTGSTGAGYTYGWTFAGGTPSTSTSNNATGVTFTTPGAHAITHTVTGPGGCTSTTNSSITIYPMPTGVTAITGPTTCGANNGTITISGASGGTSPYTYSVNGGAFSGTLNYTGQTAGSHPIIVQDANGCQFSTTVNVATAAGPTALAVTTVNSTCGTANGIINIGGTTGGAAPYTYSVNGSAFSSTTSYTGFAAGTYTVIVRDANGCTFSTTATVTNTPGPTSLATTLVQPTCGASNGSITAGAVTGGTSPYTYSFNASAFTATTSYASLAAGTFTLTVKDANGCLFTVNPVLTNIPGPTAIVKNTTNSTCGNSNGIITLGAVTGGTSPYSYSVAGSAFTSTTNYTGFAAGTYTVVVSDANSCTFSSTVTVVNSPGPTAIGVTTGNSSCGASNGTITLGAVTGGSPPYTYSVNSSAFSGTTAYIGFASGSYTVVVQDANSCAFTTTALVNNASGPTALAVTSTAANCGTNTGTVTIGLVTGGLAPYTYSYNGGAFSSTTSYSAQAAGTYNVSVRDANGCSFSTTITITNTPGPTALATSTENSTCGTANGTLSVGAVTGGTAAYTYSVNAGAFSGTTNYTALSAGTYTVTVRDANGCTFIVNPIVANTPGPTAQSVTTVNSTCGLSNGTINIGATTGGTSPYTFSFNGGTFGSATSITNLAAGTYTVTVRDANNCTFTVNPIVINTPGPTAQATSSVNATCGNTNGTVNIGVTSGGTSPFSYSFDGGGFTSTTSYTGLAAGTHTIIVQDANNCTFTVNPIVGNTPGPTAIIRNTTNSTCGGTNGGITLGAVTGGTAPYTYSVNGSPFTSATAYTALAANTYPVIVQDANGCQFTSSATVIDMSGITASITAQVNVSCNGGSNGSVTVTASGSVAPYSYSLNGGAFLGSGAFTGLIEGTYSIIAKDGNGCTITIPVTITQPSVLTGVIGTQTNINCFGGTGSVSINAGGGSTPYSYSIDGGTYASTNTFTGLNAGSHPVVIRDANGCSVNVPVTITQPTALTLTTSSVNAICTAANGSATVTAAGATPAYAYLWSPGGQTGSTASNITAGNYSVVVTDFNGCTQSASVSVGANPGGPAVISSSNNISCNGANDGSATVSMGASSTPTFTYSWSPGGQSGSTATGLLPGTYIVTVNDGNGCVSTASTIITEPSVISNLFTNTNVTCNGGSDGSSMVNPSGGTGPYIYFWTPGGQTSQTANGLTAGTYSCLITDDNGCTSTVTTTITEPPAMTVSETHIDANCNLPNGSATISAGGGVGPYSFSWNTTPPQGTPTVTNLAAGTYAVIVKDVNQCSQTIFVTIDNLSGPVATIFNSTNVSCNGENDGAATVVVSGGTPPFNYSWAPSGGTLPSASNLIADTYTLTATDVNGCSASTSVTITEPLILNSITSGTNPSCAGECDGSILTSTTGGTAPYSYLWSPGGITTQNVNGLCAGNYTLQVTDANGCVVFKNNPLTDPPAVTANTTSTNVTCSGLCNGSATANALSGNGPFTYLWSDQNAQTTQTATGLCAGTYTVTVTDADGCSAIAISTITTPSTLAISLTSYGNVSCFGACDGYASAAVSGGSAPFNYMWIPGGTSGGSVNNLCAGTYTVTVTDANGCSANTTVNISQPNALIASISNTDVSCYNASDAQATAVYVGGTGPYTFLWTPALQTTPTATGLDGGVQNLTVTDSLGCTANASVVILEPTLLAVSATTSNSNCGNADGSACASITGGSPPFVYSWNDPGLQTTSCANNLNAGVYTISVTDDHGCSVTNVANVNDNQAPTVTIPTSTDVTCGGASNGSAQGNITGGILPYSINWVPGNQNTLFVNGLAGGIYSMVVTDSVGCIGSASVTIDEPSPLISGITSSFNTSCNLACDGSATVLGGGGTAPYTYLWNDLSTQTTTTATNLCAQTYIVTVSDFNGCTSTSSVIITQPAPLAVNTVSQTNVLCNGGNTGQVTVNATGGTPGYTYNWTPNGSGTAITNLIAGAYQVTVTDLHGCTQTSNYTITEPTPLLLTPNSNPSTCGNSNGSVGVSVSGGSIPYSYFWTPSGLSSAIIPNVMAGTYNVTVTDFNGCVDTVNSTVLNLSGPTISNITFVEPSCNGLSNGTATVVATGGQPLYTYIWNTTPSQSTQTASALAAGPYQVTVSDQNECTATGTVIVQEPAPMQVITPPTDSICIGQLSQIYAAGFGGSPSYTYNWNPSSFGSTGGPFTVTPTVTTTYTVSAMDVNNCPSSVSTITVFVYPQISVTATDTNVCSGSSVGISAVANGGNGGPYTYQWDNGPTTDSQIVSPSGASSINYIVTANDIGCSNSVTDTSTVIINPLAVAFITAPVVTGCEDFTANLSAVSNMPSTFSWNFGDGTSGIIGDSVSYTYTNSGTYTVTLTVTTVLGCVSTVTNPNMIDVYPTPVAGFTTSPDLITSTSPIVTFTDQSIGANQWNWDFIYTTPQTFLFTDTLQNTSFSYPDTGTYVVQQTVTNSFGCTDVAYNSVEIIPEYVIYTPNAFTPLNHDGNNDVFMPLGVGINPDHFEMTIFDRWGSAIYKTTDVSKGWDGKANGGDKIAQIDVYVWKITTKDFSGRKHSYVGHVTIVK